MAAFTGRALEDDERFRWSNVTTLADRRTPPSSPVFMPSKFRCDATLRVEHFEGLCVGWFADGWKWHGCNLEPGHADRHRCACGVRWGRRRRGVDGHRWEKNR